MRVRRRGIWGRWSSHWQGGWQLSEPPEGYRFGEIMEVISIRDLAERIKAELHSEDIDRDNSLDGPLGKAIADVSGSYSLEFITPEQLAEGIVAWLVAE